MSAAQPEPGRPPQSRRALLAGAGLGCAALLTGCSTYDASSGFLGTTPSSAAAAPGTGAASADGATAGSGATSGSGATASSAPAALATTAEVPDGGGKIIGGKNIVITQPEAGTFKGFSAVCTHQGCIVSTVSGGTINCPCHGSRFSIKDGSVVNGPATSPLPPVAVTVDGTSIVQG